MSHLFNSQTLRKGKTLLRQNPSRLLNKLADLRVVRGPLGYVDEVMSTRHEATMLRDPAFVSAYEAGKATGSWGSSELKWRVYNICYFAWHASRLAGDFVECGVNRGGGALAIVKYLDFDRLRDKKFYLLDTYSGFVDEYVDEKERTAGATSNQYDESYEYVAALFQAYPNVILVRGAVPDTLPQVQSESISFLAIDMNVVQPEIAAMTYFWPKMISGGVVLLDDYGWSSHKLQKEAFDDFARAHDTRILLLPTGQGVVFKL